jgi:hypothetical protein
MNSPHRTKPRVDDQGRFVGYRPSAGPFNGPYQRHPADQHNRVRRERILDGSDVRTTIMLRNIPNKMDWVKRLFHILHGASLTITPDVTQDHPGQGLLRHL